MLLEWMPAVKSNRPTTCRIHSREMERILPSLFWLIVLLLMEFLVAGQSKPYRLKECRITEGGEEYEGALNVTSSGLPCQRWDSQFPHTHAFTNPAFFPDVSLAGAANHCRNPGHTNTGAQPWCYTTDPAVRWQVCAVPRCPTDFPECKVTMSGTEYRGSKNVTMSGRTCQKWDSTTIKKHFRFRFVTFEDDDNYCRNPDFKIAGPWCYVNGSDEEWEYCDVPFCKPSASCTNSPEGGEYIGTVSWTRTGRTCQRWDKQEPHTHNYKQDDMFRDGSAEAAANFCRNPGGAGTNLWCYTTDPVVRWEFCGIPQCEDCKTSAMGREYAGMLAITKSGLTCQRWDSQTPHPHEKNDINILPDISLEAAANYCRNPTNSDDGPWCYTTDPDTEWEYCNLPFCQKDGPTTPKTRVKHVIHIGIDGLKPDCIVKAPGGSHNLLQRLRQEGISTLDKGRAAVATVSAPNWSGMLCGMSMEASGITGNNWCPPWKGCEAAITPVTGRKVPLPTVFQTAKNQDANIHTAAFYSWDWLKHLASRGVPGSLDRDFYCSGASYAHCDVYVVNNATDYLYQALFSAEKSYTFVYFADVDVKGHKYGWCGQEYLKAVALADSYVGKLLDVVDDVGSYDDVLVMVGTDHGGQNFTHGSWADHDIVIPMFIRGPTVRKGVQFQHEVRNMDMAPTGLFALGLKPSPWMDAKVMVEAFEDLYV